MIKHIYTDMQTHTAVLYKQFCQVNILWAYIFMISKQFLEWTLLWHIPFHIWKRSKELLLSNTYNDMQVNFWVDHL